MASDLDEAQRLRLLTSAMQAIGEAAREGRPLDQVECPPDVVKWFMESLSVHILEGADISAVLGLTGGHGRNLRTQYLLRRRDRLLHDAWEAGQYGDDRQGFVDFADAIKDFRACEWATFGHDERAPATFTAQQRCLFQVFKFDVGVPSSWRQLKEIVQRLSQLTRTRTVDAMLCRKWTA